MLAACVINIWKKETKPNEIHSLSLLFWYFPPKYFFQPYISSVPYPISANCRYLQQVLQCYWKQPSKSLELPSVTKQFYTWASAYNRNALVFMFPCWKHRVENVLLINKNYKLIATESLPLWLLFTVIFCTVSRVSITNQVPYFPMQRSHVSRPNNVNTHKWYRTFTQLILNPM